MKGDYDLVNFIVIGDCLMDMELVKNLGVRGIWFNNEFELGVGEIEGKWVELGDIIVLIIIVWKDIYEYLKLFVWMGRIYC